MTNPLRDAAESPAQAEAERRTEQALGQLLRVGVALSATVVLTGAALLLKQRGTDVPDYSTFRPPAAGLRTIGGTLRGSLAGDGQAVIQLGILLLVATPIARVAFSIWAFARQRDRRYVLVTLAVLAVLIFSVIHGYLAGEQAT